MEEMKEKMEELENRNSELLPIVEENIQRMKVEKLQFEIENLMKHNSVILSENRKLEEKNMQMGNHNEMLCEELTKNAEFTAEKERQIEKLNEEMEEM
ncbi:hypothetical protein PFISCL1PPCAC_16975, partial [Pristionchus fissidentatus]